MLKKRLIPKILLSEGRSVKGVRFEKLRDVGHPVTSARVYEAQGVDELIFLDIRASRDGSEILERTIRATAEEVFIPFCVGGGVKSEDDIWLLLQSGADKVSINSALSDDPSLIDRGAKMFGSQCIVASIDYRYIDEEPLVFTHGGTSNTGKIVRDQVKEAVERGAGELLLTSIDRDGTMEGYDLELTRAIAESVDVPVIASGGAGSLRHIEEVLTEGGAAAAGVGSVFHFTDQSPIKARSYLITAGVEMRKDA